MHRGQGVRTSSFDWGFLPRVAFVEPNCYPHLLVEGTEHSNGCGLAALALRDDDQGIEAGQSAPKDLQVVSFRQNSARLIDNSSLGHLDCRHLDNVSGRGWRELNVTNNLVAVDKGLFLATSSTAAAGTSCSNPIIFGGAVVANTGIVQQDLIYDIQVNETLTTSPNTCFKATLVVRPNGSSATTYGPEYMNSTLSILSTYRIDCQFDIGASAPSSPYSFQLTIQ